MHRGAKAQAHRRQAFRKENTLARSHEMLISGDFLQGIWRAAGCRCVFGIWLLHRNAVHFSVRRMLAKGLISRRLHDQYRHLKALTGIIYFAVLLFLYQAPASALTPCPSSWRGGGTAFASQYTKARRRGMRVAGEREGGGVSLRSRANLRRHLEEADLYWPRRNARTRCDIMASTHRAGRRQHRGVATAGDAPRATA